MYNTRLRLVRAVVYSFFVVAAFVISLPQHIVHRFGEFKRLARHALAPMPTDHLRQGADSNTKADPTPFFYRGVHDRARTVVEEMIKTSVAAEMGFVESSVLLRDYRQAVAAHRSRMTSGGS